MKTKKRKYAWDMAKAAEKRKKFKKSPLFLPDVAGKGPELKNCEINVTSSIAFGGTGTITNILNATAQGTATNQRVGRKYRMTSFECRWQIQQLAGTVGGSPYRIMVVYDKQTNGLAPAITDIVNFDQFTGFKNLDNLDRFVTIADFITEPTSPQNNLAIGGHFYRKMDLESIWEGNLTGGAVAQCLTGSVFMIFWANGSQTVSSPSVTYFTRIRYTDV